MPNYLGIGMAAAQACEVNIGPIFAERLGRYISTQIESERADCARLMEQFGAVYIDWSSSHRRIQDATLAIRKRGENAATGERL